ncbi:MAG: SusD/RagB family nutrient-binding outer membrane lipoprotein [Chitinophagaceae bacterium]
MKYLRKLIYCIAITAALNTACNKSELKDLNINPQAKNTIDVNFLFTSAQLGAASGGSRGDNRYIDWRTNIGMASTAIQQLAAITDISNTGDKYFDNAETTSAPFEFLYTDLRSLADIVKHTGPGGFAEGESINTRQAARILRVFLFHRLTDYYGSIPYSEANQTDKGLFFPKYDKQKAVYTDLLKELDEATKAFGAADPAFAAADLYYNGDLAKWKRWGYSLMLRLAMRVSNVDAAMANTYVTKAVAGGVFQSNADNVIVSMAEGPSLWTNQNGISRAFYPGDGGNSSFLSKTLIDFLKGPNTGSTVDDDPRLMIISGGIGIWSASGGGLWQPTKTDPLDQKGLPNGNDLTMLRLIEGSTNLDLNATYSKINTKLLDRSEPYMLMNYGEVKLLLAEASQRGLGGLSAASAEAHYREGVKASMQMYTIYDPLLAVTDARVDEYLATYPYNVAKPALEMIGEQMWVNHFLNWWEAWSDWRRTGFPKLVATNYPGNVTGGKIPQKLKYPNAEVAGNPNFKTGASANDYITKVWWAGGPE